MTSLLCPIVVCFEDGFKRARPSFPLSLSGLVSIGLIVGLVTPDLGNRCLFRCD